MQNLDLHLRSTSRNLPNVQLVQGKYDYYHYNQDQEQDFGWGCAYRSGQTLFSWIWYNKQFRTGFTIPTILQMQEKLANIQDKPLSFVGSREWIGSYELFLLIDTICNSQCKLVRVADGEYAAEEIAEVLHDHFCKHGSPVMVGGTQGGAITILGVNLCTTDISKSQCLFLDPHYVGPDDIELICKEPWCFWGNFDKVFQPGAWYNFLLPQAIKPMLAETTDIEVENAMY